MISVYLSVLGQWSLNHVNPVRNGVARAIADSVTLEERYNSYVSRGGPRWLHNMVHKEALVC